MISGFIALLLSVAWLALAAFYMDTYVGLDNLMSLLPNEQAMIVAGLCAPLALIWIIVTWISNGLKLRRLRREVRSLRSLLARVAPPAAAGAQPAKGAAPAPAGKAPAPQPAPAPKAAAPAPAPKAAAPAPQPASAPKAATPAPQPAPAPKAAPAAPAPKVTAPATQPAPAPKAAAPVPAVKPAADAPAAKSGSSGDVQKVMASLEKVAAAAAKKRDGSAPSVAPAPSAAPSSAAPSSAAPAPATAAPSSAAPSSAAPSPAAPSPAAPSSGAPSSAAPAASAPAEPAKTAASPAPAAPKEPNLSVVKGTGSAAQPAARPASTPGSQTLAQMEALVGATKRDLNALANDLVFGLRSEQDHAAALSAYNNGQKDAFFAVLWEHLRRSSRDQVAKSVQEAGVGDLVTAYRQKFEDLAKEVQNRDTSGHALQAVRKQPMGRVYDALRDRLG